MDSLQLIRGLRCRSAHPSLWEVFAVQCSMTGHGEASGTLQGVPVTVELRSVNNRHFKLTLRAPDRFAKWESELERLLRRSVSRGTVTLWVRVGGMATDTTSRLNTAVLQEYWRQAESLAAQLGAPAPTDLTAFFALPGVWSGDEPLAGGSDGEWQDLEVVVEQAAEQWQNFRVREGAAMVADLSAQLAVIRERLETIITFAPQVVADYRTRLQQRIQEALQSSAVTVETGDLLREVALFTDRADISEEIVRLKSHLNQYDGLLKAETPQGRKLDFLCQELFREANTIGSKANHVGISHAAVDMKTAIERMREVVQNLE
jgi:uncharacterized protein (TIGR00255 family)